MFNKQFELYDTFMIDRANEVLTAVSYIGPSNLAWFGVGLIPTTLLITSIRIVRLIPDEEAWQLSILRFSASIVGYTTLIYPITVAAYLFFASIGGKLTWSLHNLINFWPFVIQYSTWSFYGVCLGIPLGFLSWAFVAKKLEPMIADKLHTKTNKIKKLDRLTDARTITEYLPSLKDKKINHKKCFDFAKRDNSIFLGIDENNNPVLIPLSKLNKSHIQICGPTGTGKGVQASIVLIQQLINGDAVYIFDPKCDEWAASVISQQCKKSDIPFIYINLREATPQLNIIKNTSAEELFELFVAGFGLDEKGDNADFYRLDDREAAYQLAESFKENSELSLPELFDIANEVIQPDLYESAKGFTSKLKQLVRIKALHTRNGADLASILETGGAVYVVGAMRGQDIPALQKIIALRVIQLIENQESTSRHTSIFLDEIKYLLSSPTVNAFGTIRDKNANLILTHQSLQDFRDCSKDLNPEAVEGAILTNTQIKWIYRATDPATAEWAAKLSGKILVTKERCVVDRNELLSETVRSERVIEQIERYKYDENTMLHLPDGCALLIGDEHAKLALAQPIPTTKQKFTIIPAKPVLRKSPSQDLIKCNPDYDEADNTINQRDELL